MQLRDIIRTWWFWAIAIALIILLIIAFQPICMEVQALCEEGANCPSYTECEPYIFYLFG